MIYHTYKSVIDSENQGLKVVIKKPDFEHFSKDQKTAPQKEAKIHSGQMSVLDHVPASKLLNINSFAERQLGQIKLSNRHRTREPSLDQSPVARMEEGKLNYNEKTPKIPQMHQMSKEIDQYHQIIERNGTMNPLVSGKNYRFSMHSNRYTEPYANLLERQAQINILATRERVPIKLKEQEYKIEHY